MNFRRVALPVLMVINAVTFVIVLFDLRLVALIIIAAQVAGMGAAMIFRRRRKDAQPPAGPSPEDRAAQVIGLCVTIKDLAGQVRSNRLKTSLLRGCELVPDLLDYTRQHDYDHLASTAASIGVYMQSVQTALTQYVAMQNAPTIDTPRMLHEDGKVLEQFPAFVLTSKKQLEAGDMAAYRANLQVLQPMTTKGIRG